MKKLMSAFLVLTMTMVAYSQEESMDNTYANSAEKLLSTDGNLLIGGYGEVHYNQPLSGETYNNGKLDVHRMVMLFGYRFNKRLEFITELEFEHVKEVYVEQAFLQYKLNDFMSIRGGLLLIPMGIINEYHEPTTFHGVERPLVDKYITPTTWREIGIGLTGNITNASLRYQAYVVNGFNGYDGSANLGGKNGFRKGRQKGAESYISSPNFTAKIEYYGIRGLNLGLSGYFGNTQSTLYNGLNRDDNTAIAQADSSVVGISMVGADARYNIKGFHFRGQYYLSSISNTDQYNAFTAGDESFNDLGKSMNGYYIEASYNVFHTISGIKSELYPFVRYEAYNMHASVSDIISKNNAYNNTIITSGLTWKITKNAVAKADIQFLKSEADTETAKVFNAGIGVMF